MQTTVKVRPYILEGVEKCLFSIFSKVVVGENGPKIRHKLLNLVWLGGKFPFQCNLILVYLGM